MSDPTLDHLVQRASVLMEALPYIRRFYGKVIVIKYGGHAMVDEKLKESFAKDIIMMRYIGMIPIVVHGGGPQIGSFLKKMGIESKFHQGIRITDEATMDVVEMVLVGKVNKEIVGLINQHGGRAIGLSGKDGKLLKARKLAEEKVSFDRDGVNEIIDLGRVGNVSEVNTAILSLLEKDNFIPVIAPVGVSEAGEALNINADLVAGAIASALQAEKLVLLTDVEGVKDAKGKLISELSVSKATKLIDEGVIQGGMIPKVSCCIRALASGVRSAHIIDGRQTHAVLLEIFTDKGVGTILHE
ncbi:acetylglutamate kinase [Deltaproteobacteria bacterium PRO3]|nr:acetylglutamate kinase [Deltaproteobacteria bacterium PRO3]